MKKITIIFGKDGVIIDMDGFQGRECLTNLELLKMKLKGVKLQEEEKELKYGGDEESRIQW
jgi:hypothetical protein